MREDEADKQRVEEYMWISSERMAERMQSRLKNKQESQATGSTMTTSARPAEGSGERKREQEHFEKDSAKVRRSEGNADSSRTTRQRPEGDVDMGEEDAGKKRRIGAIHNWEQEMERAMKEDRHDTAEIYPPSRVVKEAHGMGLQGGGRWT